jgi:hypothetical protein
MKPPLSPLGSITGCMLSGTNISGDRLHILCAGEPARTHAHNREQRLIHIDGLAQCRRGSRKLPFPQPIADHCNGIRSSNMII